MIRNDLVTKAVARIPPQLRHGEFRFVPIIVREKRPFEHKWNTVGGNNYRYDDPKLSGFLLEGHNYGVCTGMGGLVVLDSDEEPRLRELGISDELPETFSVRTGGGGIHRYYTCDDIGDKIILYDQELLDGRGEPLHLGEVQTSGFQVVGAGSLHPNGNRYEIEHDMPVAKIEWSDVYDILAKKTKMGLAIPQKRRTIIKVKNPNMSDPFERARVDDIWQPSGNVKHNGGILTGSHPLHGSKGGKNFQVNTNMNTWFCFRCWSGGGPALAIAVKEKLIRCDQAKKGVLRGDLYIRLLKIAEERGYIRAPRLSVVERVA